MTEENKTEKKKNHGKFFAVDKNKWAGVCSNGIHAAVAYLVLAVGTGKDHKSTKWSARSVNKYTGMPFLPAKKAIKKLVGSNLVREVVSGNRPEYQINLSLNPQLIWLPNSIIEGVRRGKASPVKQLFMTSNVRALQLFIDLYSLQDLENESGISAAVLYKDYGGGKVFEYGKYAVWYFIGDTIKYLSTTNHELYQQYQDQDLLRDANKIKDKKKQKQKRDESFKEFWNALQVIEDLDLIEWVPQLFSGEGGVHILPYGTGLVDTKHKDAAMENKIGRAAYVAAAAMNAAFQMRQEYADIDDVLEELELEEERAKLARYTLGLRVPIIKHIQAPIMRSVARLKFRPHTLPTRKWYGQLMDKGAEQVQEYQQLALQCLYESGLAEKPGDSVENSVSDSFDLTGT